MTEILCLDRTVVQKKPTKSKKEKQNKTKTRKKTIYQVLVYKLFNRTIYTQGECKLMYYVVYVCTIKLLPAIIFFLKINVLS
jgi:ATP-dependent Clp protease adapter protein ClpS